MSFLVHRGEKRDYLKKEDFSIKANELPAVVNCNNSYPYLLIHILIVGKKQHAVSQNMPKEYFGDTQELLKIQKSRDKKDPAPLDLLSLSIGKKDGIIWKKRTFP